jgi:hypothetical protein
MHKIGKVAVMPIIIAAGGFIVPETRSLPVAGAGPADWNLHALFDHESLAPAVQLRFRNAARLA